DGFCWHSQGVAFDAVEIARLLTERGFAPLGDIGDEWSHPLNSCIGAQGSTRNKTKKIGSRERLPPQIDSTHHPYSLSIGGVEHSEPGKFPRTRNERIRGRFRIDFEKRGKRIGDL